MWDERINQYRDITDIFQSTAEARWCPMVVTGSAVSLITRTVLGGLLARRFGSYHLRPFQENHTIEYALKLSEITGIKITEDISAKIHELTGGNPHYIWCIFNSIKSKESLCSVEDLMEVYEYEMSDVDGKLRRFWDLHFLEYADKINSSGISFRLLYHFATSEKEEVHIKDFAEYLGVDKAEEIKRVLMDLEQADLIEYIIPGVIFYRMTDPVLKDYIIRTYKTELERQSFTEYIKDFRKDFFRKMGSLNERMGHAAEMFTMILMERFKGQKVDSKKIFGVEEGEVILPRFKEIKRRSGVIAEGRPVEIDLIGEGEEEVWFVEVKYWEKPVSIEEVMEFKEKVKGFESEQGPQKSRRSWIFARNGFTEEVRRCLEELGVRHSDAYMFNLLAEAIGAIKLPI